MEIISSQQISQHMTANEKQLRLLNLQKEYEIKVRGEALAIVKNTYANIENNQTKLFEKMQGDLQKAIDKIIKDVDHSADICRRTSKHAKETSEKLFKLKTWWDLIWYASPIAVFLNLIWRVFVFFSGG